MATFTKTYKVNIRSNFTRNAFHKSFTRIQNLLDSEPLVSELLTIMEGNLVTEMRVRNDPSYAPANALYDALRIVEDMSGFDPGRVVFIERVLQPREFGDIVKARKPLLDPNVTPRHGAETHRIQWAMVALDMMMNPNEYDAEVRGDQLVKLYRSTMLQGKHKDESPPVGEQWLWVLTFDALQGRCNTARAPESLKEYFSSGRFPTIAAAEEQQMKWATCVKHRYDTWKGLGPVRRMNPQFLEVNTA